MVSDDIYECISYVHTYLSSPYHNTNLYTYRTAATVELFFGFPYVAFLWLTGLRKAPKLSFDNVKTLSSQAFFLAATHVAGVISFGAGAISFTHILKATEPKRRRVE